MFEEKREEFPTRVWSTSGDIPATLAPVSHALIPHQRLYTGVFGHGCSSHPRHHGELLAWERGTVQSCHLCALQLAWILHSMSVCSADRYRLKPSAFPKTLCWRCDFLSNLGATALLMPFCPSSKDVWKKKAVFQRLHDKAEGGSHSKAMLVRSLLKAD